MNGITEFTVADIYDYMRKVINVNCHIIFFDLECLSSA